MKERGIIFSGDNPKLIQEGRKTQTRRIIRFPKDTRIRSDREGLVLAHAQTQKIIPCPYGVVGDRLWVREAHTITEYTYGASVASLVRLRGFYNCDKASFNVTLNAKESELFKNRKRKTGSVPGRFMYRSLSRILLDLLKNGGERLQDISYDDICAEGWNVQTSKPTTDGTAGQDARAWYHQLWDSLHGKGAWDKNPLVWVLGFRKIDSESQS